MLLQTETTDAAKKEYQSYKETGFMIQPTIQPNYRLIALEQAGNLQNKDLNELLGRAEEIERWLMKNQ